jgi:hypothetical protein
VTIESAWSSASIVCNRLQLLQCCGAVAAALEHQPGPREWRAQIMRDVIADPCQGPDEALHLVEHSVDDHGKFGKRIVSLSVRQSFAQIAGDDALDALVDLDDAPAAARVQRHANRKAEKYSRNQTKRQRPANDACNLLDFIDVSSGHQHVAVRQLLCNQPYRLFRHAVRVQPVDHSAPYRIIRPETWGQAFQITRDPPAV